MSPHHRGWAVMVQKSEFNIASNSLTGHGAASGRHCQAHLRPSLYNLKMRYIDGCTSPHELNVGEEVEAIMIDAASQTFTAESITGETASHIPPDKEILITLERSVL